MNIRPIQPISFWQNGDVVEASHLMLYNFHGYDFNDMPSRVSYKLLLLIPTSGSEADGIAEPNYVSVYENSVLLPYEIVSVWGEDDEIIWDYVFEQLNLTEKV